MPWTALKDKLAELLNVHPTTLHAQYRLSTDSKASLPFDLTSQTELNNLLNVLHPLVVPPILASGRRSTRRMKPVSVQISNKGDVQPLQIANKVSRIFDASNDGANKTC